MLDDRDNKHYICSVLIVAVMFVRIKTTGKNQYLQIVENHSEGTKVKQHILGTLGRVDQIVGTKDIDGLIYKLSGYTQEALMVITGQSEIQSCSSSVGEALIFKRLWNELHIPSIIHKLIEKRKVDHKHRFTGIRSCSPIQRILAGRTGVS